VGEVSFKWFVDEASVKERAGFQVCSACERLKDFLAFATGSRPGAGFFQSLGAQDSPSDPCSASLQPDRFYSRGIQTAWRFSKRLARSLEQRISFQ
jgi:hypothetical protein